MQQLIDFFPLVAFFVAYKLGGIYVATATLIVACAIQIGWHWLRTRKVKTLHWVTAVLVLLLGSTTLLLHDSRFIQWKPSVLMWLLSGVFLASQFIGAKPLARRSLEGILGEGVSPLSTRTWALLNLGWVVFFALVGAVNLYVATQYPEPTWVNFKVFGLPVLTIVFMLPQIVWLMPKEDETGPPAPADKRGKSDA